VSSPVSSPSGTPPEPEADGLPWPRRAFASAAQLTGVATVLLDAFSVNLALPAIAAEFGRDPATSTAIVTAFQVVVIAALLPMAALAQRVGYARVYITGLMLYALMALVSATAQSFEVLVAARMAQGLAASAVMGVNMALLRMIAPSADLGRALGINAMVVALASSAGPTVAGLVLAVADWHWIFAMAVPFALISALVGRLVFPETTRVAGPIDLPGAGLSALTFATLLMALAGIGQGWPLLAVLMLGATGLGAASLLVRRMRGQPAPILPVDLLRIRLFALSVSVSLCAFAVQMLTLVTLPFHLQVELGFSTVQAGLAFSGWPLAVAAIAPVAGWLSDRFPPGYLGAAGLVGMALALWVLANLPPGAGPVAYGVALALGGLGFGLFQTPNNRTMIGLAPRNRSSAASASLSTARLLGQAIGTALAALALSGVLGAGAEAGLGLGIGIALLGAAVSLARGKVRVRTS
jgi:DHA2 family multidrug resistance protein-like MFS transporter